MKFTENYSAVMIQCHCGDVFRADGSAADIQTKQQVWETAHRDCGERKREGRKVFWMSFCDSAKPEGEQFLGACVIEVDAVEADDSAIEVLLRFPFAKPGAEWIAAATRKAHRLGCNPGGEIVTAEIPTNHPNLARYPMGVLMDRATCERLERELEA